MQSASPNWSGFSATKPPLLPPNQALAFTYQAAAKLLQVSDRTVWKWVDEGRLKCIRIDGTVRISRQAIEDFIRESEHRATEGGEA